MKTDTRHRDKLERDLNQLLAAAKHLAECDCQSNYIKVPCVQCDAAHAIIKQCDVAAMTNIKAEPCGSADGLLT